MKNKTWIVALSLGLSLMAPAFAQGKFPEGTLKLIVPFAAGGGVDQAARLLGKQLQTDLGVSVIVENKAGASGTIGGKAVQTATPDGMTLLFSAATHVLAKQVLAVPPYDPQTDFAPVARVGEAPLMLVIPPTAPQKNLKEVLEAAQAQPDKWTAAVPALGAPSHLATLLLAQQGKLKLTMTPYRGTAPALADVAGGHVQLLMDSIISIQAMAKAGKVKAIAVSSSQRSGVAPEVPTAVESGFPGVVYNSWYGVWAPKGTPPDRVQILNKAINKATAGLARAGSFTALGILPVLETTDQFRRFVASDVARSAELLKDAGFKPE
ncbi:MAG: tripartite tricarboxylate transporter substrate binding protein [Hydrogenophaga sp.]|nr:tripartite tricarboxylate transporter substrate binding protein [Hydrogenophaga sp.]